MYFHKYILFEIAITLQGIERLQKEFEKNNQRLRFLNVSPSVIKTIRMMSDIESLQILETDENIIECFQDLEKRTDYENNSTISTYLIPY